MKGKKHSPEQIVRKLQEADAMLTVGKTVGQVCQALEVGESIVSACTGCGDDTGCVCRKKPGKNDVWDIAATVVCVCGPRARTMCGHGILFSIGRRTADRSSGFRWWTSTRANAWRWR